MSAGRRDQDSTPPDPALARLIAAVQAEDGTGWVVADAAAELPETSKLADVSTAIYQATGIERSPAVLGRYRSTSRAFPIELRSSTVTFHAHLELRAHPDKLIAWAKANPGKTLTVDGARAIRPGSSGRAAKPKAVAQRLVAVERSLAAMAEEDPLAVVSMLESLLALFQKRYGSRIDKAKAHGLRAV